ncbi:MAG: hypothetical protein IPK32_01330 [Verrucomicrobiaceae bacterium]|nr:hypothetical protein [Verrucomicrobiaceae bacterium]
MTHYIFDFVFLLVWVDHGFAVDAKFNPDPSTWESVHRPKKNALDLEDMFLARANQSDHDWTVESVNGKVVARLRTQLLEKKRVAPPFNTRVKLDQTEAEAFRMSKVGDGWIVAYNQGEWGGAVFWFNGDGSKRKKLSDHQINQFLVEGDRLFAIEGLAHLGGSRGSMIEILKVGEEWKAEEFLALSSSPEVVARVGAGDYLIVTTNSLLRVNLKKEKTTLIPNTDWGILYPSSIVVDGHFVYVGMRQFVVRYDLRSSTPHYDLLVPDSKWLNVTK